MRNRILAIVMALSMIAVLFAALPTKAAVPYTGTVMTTDSSGVAKTEFIQGEPVYVNVEAMANGVASSQTITVSLVRTNGGQVSSFTTNTNGTGWYNSSQAPSHHTLSTFSGISGDVQSYYVIVTLPTHGGVEIARSEVVVRAVGLTLTPSPSSNPYWPGEQIDATLVVNLAQSALVFYVQVVNATGAQTGINFTSQTATSGFWSQSFMINQSMPDGAYTMNVRAQLDSSIWYSQSFVVQAFVLSANTQRSFYLPGETAQINYFVIDYATLSALTSGINITYSAEYQNPTGNLTWQNGTLPISQTTWDFTLPVNGTGKHDIALYSDISITLKATDASASRSVERYLTLQLGMIQGSVSLNSAFVNPGGTVVVTVNAQVSGSSLDGARVDVTVARNGSQPISAYGAMNLTTDLSGTATYMFKVVSSAAEGNYIVTATISKVGYSAVRQNQFTVQSISYMTVALDRAYYYGGQEATASFAAVVNGMPFTADGIGYLFTLSGTLLASGNTTMGSATVTIPDGSYGMLQVQAFTHINGNIVSGFANAQVYFAQLGLTAEKGSYRPGDTVTFDWSIVTGLMSANLAYEILDSNGAMVANGTPAFAKTGSFEFSVPGASPLLSTSYQATLRMTTPEGGYATASTTVNLISQAELSVSIGKSSYTSGEFAPGQTIKIHYDLSSYVLTPSSTIRLHVSVSFDPVAFDVIVNSLSGTISYTIPKDAPMATYTVSVWAYDAATGTLLASDQSAFQVNNQASGWDMSIAGMSAIDLVILVLLIIVIIMLIIVPYTRDRMARPKPPETKPMELTQPTPPPPSEPGKTPPSQ